MVVTDGFFNNAAVRRELDQKYPTLMKKSNPANVMYCIFKDKVHFDVQNPIIGSLAAKVSNNEKPIFEQIKKSTFNERCYHIRKIRKVKKV